MSKTQGKRPDQSAGAVDPLLNVPPDTRTDREKFVDQFTERYQDKNPRDQADAIVWAIEEMILLHLGAATSEINDATQRLKSADNDKKD